MIKEITAKSILRKHNKIDSWFITSYGINLYRGCTHNCVYCDGRDEKYRVDGEFGRDISVKSNALELLRVELDPARKRKPFHNGYFGICGGVSDAHQPFESTTGLCRKTLELLCAFRHPVHILTKSTLVERDIDVLQQIRSQSSAIVSFSFSSVSDAIGKVLEPGVPAPSQRLAVLKKCKEAGLWCGMYLMPVVPFITDTREMIETSVARAKDAGADFIVFGGMTLKTGRQRDYFMNFLSTHFPGLIDNYGALYPGQDPWGAPRDGSMEKIERVFDEIATRLCVPKRVPSKIFESLVSPKELAIIILEQLDYLIRLKGARSPYGFAAHALSQLERPIEEIPHDELARQKGIGEQPTKVIKEIMQTKRCALYEKILA
jgi:DNA repair photolyase